MSNSIETRKHETLKTATAIAGVKFNSGIELLAKLGITSIAELRELGNASPLLFFRTSDQSPAIAEYGAPYGHIPKGLNGSWQRATALATASYTTGLLDSFLDSDATIGENVAAVFSNPALKARRRMPVSPEHISAGFMLVFLLGRVPALDDSGLWKSTGTTLASFDAKCGIDPQSALSAENVQNTVAQSLAVFVGARTDENAGITAGIRRANRGSRIALVSASDSEIETRKSVLSDTLSDDSASDSDIASAVSELIGIDNAQRAGTAIVRHPITGALIAETDMPVFPVSDVRGNALIVQFNAAVNAGDQSAVNALWRELENHASVNAGNVARTESGKSVPAKAKRINNALAPKVWPSNTKLLDQMDAAVKRGNMALVNELFNKKS